MIAQYLTEEELERMIVRTLSCPPDLVSLPGFACGVWGRIDAWEAEQERKRASSSIFARLMQARMKNGEPLVVLAAALAFSALFVGVFLTGVYMLAVSSPVILRVVQSVVGPNLGELRSWLILCTLTTIGGLLLGSLALSERLFGQKSTPRIEPTCSVGGGAAA